MFVGVLGFFFFWIKHNCEVLMDDLTMFSFNWLRVMFWAVGYV